MWKKMCINKNMYNTFPVSKINFTYHQTFCGCVFSDYRVHMEAQTLPHIGQSVAESECVLHWLISPFTFTPHSQHHEHYQPHTEQLQPDCTLSTSGPRNHL